MTQTRSSQGFRPKLLALSVAACFGAPPALANPTGGAVVSGSASISSSGNTLTVNNSANAIINWQSFSIGANEITKFIQNSSASAVLNRVIGSGGVIPQSIINGILSSNGQVFLLNPSGVIIGANATIDVAGLVTSSLNLSNEDFLAGRLRFTEVPGAGAVRNEGSIETPSGGRVFLIAPNVENSGIIRAPDGQIVLAAGKSVELAAENTPFVTVKITADNNEALNVGSLVAKGGHINMHGALVRQSGIAEAGSAVVGANGEIRLVASKDLTLAAGSRTTASGAAGGNITLQAEGGTNLVQGTVEATGSSGKGGTVQALGVRVGVVGNGVIDASGETGGGTVLVGGDYQGKNVDVQNAQLTFIGADGIIRADAKNSGDGGRVIVWADEATRFGGTISVRGGANSGNGGFVETSGHLGLDVTGGRVDARAPLGNKGTWLLDPRDIDIVATGGTASSVTEADSFFENPSTDLSIDTATLYYGLNYSSVSLLANRDIRLQTSVDASSYGSDLSLIAYGDISMQGHSITMGGGNLTLTADFDRNGVGSITHTPGSNLITNGGLLSLSGAGVSVGSINTRSPYAGGSGGNVTVVAYGGNIAINGPIDTRGRDADLNSVAGGSGGYVKLYTESPSADSSVQVFGDVLTYGGHGTASSAGYYGGHGGHGGDVFIQQSDGYPIQGTGSINVNGSIDTHGGNGGSPTARESYSSTGEAGYGGNVKLGAVGGVRVGGDITTAGGTGGSGAPNNVSYGATPGASGGTGGDITVYGDSFTTIYGNVVSSGGSGGKGGNGTSSSATGGDGGSGGQAGTIILGSWDTTDQTQALVAYGNVSADGGMGGTGGDIGGAGGNGHDGGQISIYGGSIDIKDVSALGGKGGDGASGAPSDQGSPRTGGSGGEIYLTGGTVSTGTLNAGGGDGGIYGGDAGSPKGASGGGGGMITVLGSDIRTASLLADGGQNRHAGGKDYYSEASASRGGYIGAYSDGGIEVSGDVSTKGGSNNYGATLVTLEAGGGDVIVTGSIRTFGQAAHGGGVSIRASDRISIAGDIDTHGADGTHATLAYPSSYYGGWDGGDVHLERTSSGALSGTAPAVSVGGSIRTHGGNAIATEDSEWASAGWGGWGGLVEITGYGGGSPVAGAVSVGGNIDTHGGNGTIATGNHDRADGGEGGRAGWIDIATTSSVTIQGSLIAHGGSGGAGADGYASGGGGNGAYGGDGGWIDISLADAGDVNIGGSILTYGGSGGNGGSVVASSNLMRGGDGAYGGGAGMVEISLNGTSGNVSIGGSVHTYGGAGGNGGSAAGSVTYNRGGNGGEGGYGNIFTVYAPGDVTVAGDIRSFGGAGGSGGESGAIESLGGHGADGGYGGHVGFFTEGSVSVGGAITTYGGNGGAGGLAHSTFYGGGNGGAGGYGGNVFIPAQAGISLHDVDVSGGNAGAGGANTSTGPAGTSPIGGGSGGIQLFTEGSITLNGGLRNLAGLDGQGMSRNGTGETELAAYGSITQNTTGAGIVTDALYVTAAGSAGNVTLENAGNDFSYIDASGAYGYYGYSPIQGSVSIVNSNANSTVDIFARDAVSFRNTHVSGSIAVGEVESTESSVTLVSNLLFQHVSESVHAATYFQYYTADGRALTVDQSFFNDIHAPEVRLGSTASTGDIALSGPIVRSSTDTLTLMGGNITQDSYLQVGSLNAHAYGGSVTLTNGGNSFGYVNGSAAGSFSVVSAGSLNPNSNGIHAGGDITLVNSLAYAGNAWNLGSIVSDTGAIRVKADNIGVAYGSTAMDVRGTQSFTWETADNSHAIQVGPSFFSAVHTPTIGLGGVAQTGDIVITGASDLGASGTSTLSLYTAGRTFQQEGAAIKVASLSARGSEVLFGSPTTVNSIQNFQGQATAGALSLVTDTALKLTSISGSEISAPGASATDLIVMLADGDISTDIIGSYALNAPSVSVLSTGALGTSTAPLEIHASIVDAVSGTGGHLTTNRLDPQMVTINTLVNDGIGHIVLNAHGGATTTTLVDNPGGNVDIHTFSPLNILGGINAGGNIALSTSGSGNNDLQLDGTFTYGGTSFSAIPGAGGLSILGTGYQVVALAPAGGGNLVDQLIKTDSSFTQALDMTTKETAKTTETTTSSLTGINKDSPTQDEEKEEDKKKGTKVGAAVCS